MILASAGNSIATALVSNIGYLRGISILRDPLAVVVNPLHVAARSEINAHAFVRRDEQRNANRNAVLERRLFPGAVLLEWEGGAVCTTRASTMSGNTALIG